MLLVALTGNYGMGKSTVFSLFRKFGFSTLDADSIVGSLFRKKEILEKIKQLMGDTVFNDNGSLNKKRVAEVIFKNASLRHSLENLLHPFVFDKIKKADFLIDNNGTLTETKMQVEKLYKKLLKEAGNGNNQRARRLKRKLS